jgi:1-aminocyclopropane-1-carboxylate deaminase/D-cysteine desulfhydrase-like pyridoxal-dependent ACC family enzyme
MTKTRVALAETPTPVERIASLGGGRSELWVKHDDRTHAEYGGNKVRKLEALLADARERGARRLVTVGAVGSHHVLATTYFGKRAGFEVEAVLVPQPRTEHVVEVLRADLALGLRAFPVGSWGAAPWAIAARAFAGGAAGKARVIPVGGSSVLGSMPYVEAGLELAAQVRAGEVPEPDVCVVALGSGGTAGGLAAGFAAGGLRTTVVGVCVSTPPWALTRMTHHFARACARRHQVPGSRLRLVIDRRFLGPGYAHPTPEGAEATSVAADLAGLPLDPTYTAKTFACALWFVRARRARHILYWHTLSSAPMTPLLEGAPREEEIPRPLRALILNTPSLSRDTSAPASLG